MIKAIATILMTAGLILATPLFADPVNFRIDTNHSNVGFSVPIAGGLSKVQGKFSEFEMDLVYDREDIKKSTVSVKIKSASIDTGIDGRDKHLRTADFFDVEKYPEIVFKSKNIFQKDGRTVLVGDLTMKGVTKEIRFPIEVTGDKTESRDGKTFASMGFEGKLVLDRTDFGVNYQHKTVPGFIGNVIEIDLNILTRPSEIVPTKKAE